jgi:hypothetical protein
MSGGVGGGGREADPYPDSSGSRFGLVARGLIPSTDRQHAEQIRGFILRKRSPNEICRDLRMKTGLNGNALIEQ